MMKAKKNKSLTEEGKKAYYRRLDVKRNIERILRDVPEGTPLKDIAIKALTLMGEGYEYRGKHPITEAFEQICEM